MLATLTIDHYQLNVIIGVYKAERQKPQPIFLTAHITLDIAKAAASDNVADTLDYDALTTKIRSSVEDTRYQLLESLAAHILKLIKEELHVVNAKIKLSKPKALKRADKVTLVLPAH